jgi:hypothetical protein
VVIQNQPGSVVAHHYICMTIPWIDMIVHAGVSHGVDRFRSPSYSLSAVQIYRGSTSRSLSIDPCRLRPVIGNPRLVGPCCCDKTHPPSHSRSDRFRLG